MDARPVAVVYSDPNCPFCYAQEERLHDLGLWERTEWRGVQHAPELPVPMGPASPGLAAELDHEGRSLAALAPDLPLTVPSGKPSTKAAIEHAAAALRRDDARGRAFVRSLYRTFWREGADLSDAAVLERLAGDAGLTPLVVTDDDRQRTHAWNDGWRRLGLGGVPCIVRHDGQLLYGLSAPSDLVAFLAP